MSIKEKIAEEYEEVFYSLTGEPMKSSDREYRDIFIAKILSIIRDEIEGMKKDKTTISGMWMELQRRIGWNAFADELLGKLK